MEDNDMDDLDLDDLDYDKILKTDSDQEKNNPENQSNITKCIGTNLPTKLNLKSDFTSKFKKFEQLKKKSEEIRHYSKLRQLKTKQYKDNRLLKKKSKTGVCSNNSSNSLDNDNKEKWQDIKPYLTVNDHLQGPVLHGDCGPKTELECIIDDAIKDGDFEKAEILSDTLANRAFAVKIANAFDAKRYAERKAEEDKLQKIKRLKKLRWGFEAKERWEMKGNM